MLDGRCVLDDIQYSVLYLLKIDCCYILLAEMLPHMLNKNLNITSNTDFTNNMVIIWYVAIFSMSTIIYSHVFTIFLWIMFSMTYCTRL